MAKRSISNTPKQPSKLNLKAAWELHIFKCRKCGGRNAKYWCPTGKKLWFQWTKSEPLVPVGDIWLENVRRG